jgi:carbon-monoxide dehydrogenase medium subunit
MIAQEFDYLTPATLDEALTLLEDPGAKLLAGGMSLIPLMKLRLAAPEKLVDLRKVPGLNGITESGGALRIGAMVTHYEIESSPLVRARCPLLAEAAAQIGDVQVRNCGTIGGSLAHNDPAADYPASLHALEAQVRLARAGADRVLPIGDFLIDTFTTALEPAEILAEVIVPIDDAATGAAYAKCVHPASGFAVAGVAARIRRSAGNITMARIGVTGVAPSSYRATAAETALEGSAGSAADIQRAAALVVEGVEPNSDLYAGAAYRAQLGRVYAARAITAAMSRA